MLESNSPESHEFQEWKLPGGTGSIHHRYFERKTQSIWIGEEKNFAERLYIRLFANS